MNYKATFELNNGIKGEVKFAANNQGDAFVSASKMFSAFKNVKWNVEKMESIFRPKEALKKSIDGIEIVEERVASIVDSVKAVQNCLPEEKYDGEEWRKYDEILKDLENVSDYLAYAKESVQEVQKLMQ